jgi:hypothetical protein
MFSKWLRPATKMAPQVSRRFNMGTPIIRSTISGPLNSGIQHKIGGSIFQHRGFATSTDDFSAQGFRNMDIPHLNTKSAGFKTGIGATLFPSKTPTTNKYTARHGGAQGSDSYLSAFAAGPGHMEITPPYMEVEEAGYKYCAAGDASSTVIKETDKKRSGKSSSRLFSWPSSEKKSPSDSSSNLSTYSNSGKSSKADAPSFTQSAPNLGSYPSKKSGHQSSDLQLSVPPKRPGNSITRRYSAFKRELAGLRAPKTKGQSPYRHSANQTDSALTNPSSSSIYLPSDKKSEFSPFSSHTSFQRNGSYTAPHSTYTSYQTSPSTSQGSFKPFHNIETDYYAW